jgi:hypothetical protein
MSVLSAVLASVLVVGGGVPGGVAPDPRVPDSPTAVAGNPFVDGWYADPDVAVYEGKYWVYPTSSRPYDEQTYLDAFSSEDLVHWTRHPNVLTTANVSWARRAVWAPAPLHRAGKYYLYFGANDIQSDSELGGIGVAVSDRPEGPYVDAIGRPLIDAFHNGAQPIDQDVFVDDDGQAYMYYGGWGHANVVKLNEDMTSLGTFDDGSTFKEITPANFTEGSQMVKRNGKYYFMWSEGGWTGPDYAVSYAIADSPTGPFERIDRILTQDAAVARGSGHNAVLNIPGTDTWYIFYHRRPLSETGANARMLAYDRMRFAADGTMERVVMRVHDNFADHNAIGWKAGDPSWSAATGSYRAARGTSLLDTDFGDLSFDADVVGGGGLVFRDHYYAGLDGRGRLVLERDGERLATAALPGPRHHLRVEAAGGTITVLADGVRTMAVDDATWTSGRTGLRVKAGPASFDNVVIAHLSGS